MQIHNSVFLSTEVPIFSMTPLFVSIAQPPAHCCQQSSLPCVHMWQYGQYTHSHRRGRVACLLESLRQQHIFRRTKYFPIFPRDTPLKWRGPIPILPLLVSDFLWILLWIIFSLRETQVKRVQKFTLNWVKWSGRSCKVKNILRYVMDGHCR